jgi:hypothetical protein
MVLHSKFKIHEIGTILENQGEKWIENIRNILFKAKINLLNF